MPLFSNNHEIKKVELEQEFELHKARLIHASKAVGKSLLNDVMMRRWIGLHPLAAVSIGVIAGILIAQKLPLGRNSENFSEVA
jgi:hypothetical protein